MRGGFDRFLVVFLATVLTAPAFAFQPTGTAASMGKHPVMEAGLAGRPLQVFTLSNSGNVAILNDEGNAVKAFVGTLTSPSQAPATEIALSYVKELDAKSRYDVVSSIEADGETHVRMTQSVDGLPVFGPDVSVHVARDGRITMVNGTTVSPAKPVNALRIGVGTATEVATAALGKARVVEASRVLFPAAEGLRVAWKLELEGATALWVAVVDGETSELLMAADRLQHLSGSGSVYQVDPLHGSPTVEVLPNMTAGDQLKGLYADVKNEDGDRAASADRKYVYEPNNTHFDEVMMYFQINRVHDFFKTLGFDKLDKAMTCTVHVGDRYDNAYFNPRDGSLNFGDGNKLNDLSKDASVAYHEYTHAVTNALCPGMMWGEGGGLHEGYSDYFAGTMLNDSKVGAYAAQRLPGGVIRDMNNTLHYPEDAGTEAHQQGKVWGGACWDLRKAVGAGVADKIIHQSRFYLSGYGVKFADGYQGILKADKNLFNGSHAAKITEVFLKRGIAKPATEVGPAQLMRMDRFEALLAK